MVVSGILHRKVNQLDLTIICYINILCPYLIVHYLIMMKLLKRQAHLCEDREALVLAKERVCVLRFLVDLPFLFNYIKQALSFDALSQNTYLLTFGLKNLMAFNQIRMLDNRSYVRLPQLHFNPFFVQVIIGIFIELH